MTLPLAYIRAVRARLIERFKRDLAQSFDAELRALIAEADAALRPCAPRARPKKRKHPVAAPPTLPIVEEPVEAAPPAPPPVELIPESTPAAELLEVAPTYVRREPTPVAPPPFISAGDAPRKLIVETRASSVRMDF